MNNNNNNNADGLFVNYKIFDDLEFKIPYLPILKFAYQVYGGNKINIFSPAYTTCHLNEDIMKITDVQDQKIKKFLKEIPEALWSSGKYEEFETYFIDKLKCYIENHNSNVTEILYDVFGKLTKFGTKQPTLL